ncbi:HNH endonuclease [Sporosarcina aquimarina]|uniref:HNH endonuclease n=1 Tax=Sporosarcina aquimarina TaxID=114975 RepID=UPI001C8D4DF2|nr:HNH endonuclease [Sporosarcina aquimarina]MBY0221621.1 HNH endonuclease [Sporosarcina aquimarina]
MIKLTKLNEPGILEENAENWKSLYLAYKTGDKSVSKNIGTKYSHKEVKTALIKETHGKCAYCESKILHTSFGDIEHILPKSEIPEKCFEWSNLTLACPVCNNRKRDYYDNNNLLIDPYEDEPSAHLFFAGPLVSYISERGNLTGLKIDLNRTELVENRTKHLKSLDGFIMQIQNTTLPELRTALFDDLRKTASISEEYSKMVRDFIEVFESKVSTVNG